MDPVSTIQTVTLWAAQSSANSPVPIQQLLSYIFCCILQGNFASRKPSSGDGTVVSLPRGKPQPAQYSDPCQLNSLYILRCSVGARAGFIRRGGCELFGCQSYTGSYAPWNAGLVWEVRGCCALLVLAIHAWLLMGHP